MVGKTSHQDEPNQMFSVWVSVNSQIPVYFTNTGAGKVKFKAENFINDFKSVSFSRDLKKISRKLATGSAGRVPPARRQSRCARRPLGFAAFRPLGFATKIEKMVDHTELIQNEVFLAFASYATIVLSKMMFLSLVTGFYRMTRKAFVNPEDCAVFGKGEEVKKYLWTDNRVERARRAHLNDLENIVPFLVHLGKEDLDVRNCSEPVSLSQWSSLTQFEILYSPSSLSSKCWDILGHSRRTRKGSRSLVKDCKELCEEERLRKMFCRTSGPMEGKQKSFQLQTL
ncbi:Microsomal glutathione S-transferase 1 [Manis javanica]|nr:Microsomal glutathione S-transferase 1 [Manis javanica]